MPRTGQVPSPLEIRLFGPFRVTVDGQPLRVRKNDKLVDPLKNRESRWLLAALAPMSSLRRSLEPKLPESAET